MLTVAVLIERIERDFIVCPTVEGRLAVNGEPYVVLGDQTDGKSAMAGTVNEGTHRQSFFDEEAACVGVLNCFSTYAEGRGKFLFWRHPKKYWLEWDDPHKKCLVYVRLLVSNRQYEHSAHAA